MYAVATVCFHSLVLHCYHICAIPVETTLETTATFVLEISPNELYKSMSKVANSRPRFNTVLMFQIKLLSVFVHGHVLQIRRAT